MIDLAASAALSIAPASVSEGLPPIPTMSPNLPPRKLIAPLAAAAVPATSVALTTDLTSIPANTPDKRRMAAGPNFSKSTPNISNNAGRRSSTKESLIALNASINAPLIPVPTVSATLSSLFKKSFKPFVNSMIYLDASLMILGAIAPNIFKPPINMSFSTSLIPP